MTQDRCLPRTRAKWSYWVLSDSERTPHDRRRVFEGMPDGSFFPGEVGKPSL